MEAIVSLSAPAAADARGARPGLAVAVLIAVGAAIECECRKFTNRKIRMAEPGPLSKMYTRKGTRLRPRTVHPALLSLLFPRSPSSTFASTTTTIASAIAIARVIVSRKFILPTTTHDVPVVAHHHQHFLMPSFRSMISSTRIFRRDTLPLVEVILTRL